MLSLDHYASISVGIFLCLPLRAFGQYDQNIAIEFAKLAGAAYCDKESLESWTCPQCTANVTSVKVCEAKDDGTQAFVGRWGDSCVLSVEGTEDIEQVLTDLEIYTEEPQSYDCKHCSVHVGFLDTWRSLNECLTKNLKAIGCAPGQRPLKVTGHSLGAAVSAIGIMSLRDQGWETVQSYNFGMPRTGNDFFAANLTTYLAGGFYRLTHHRDPIVQLPPDDWRIYDWSYRHVEPEVFYDGAVDQGFTECSKDGNLSCSGKYWEVFFPLNISDHRYYVGVPLGWRGCKTTPPAIMV